MRGTMVVARCMCGAPVIGSHEQPHPNRLWCGECVSFVNAAIRGADAFHGYLPDDGLDVVGFMSRLEARLIESALERAGTTAGAARLLGLNRTTLVEKLKRARRAQKAHENDYLPEQVDMADLGRSPDLVDGKPRPGHLGVHGASANLGNL